MSTILIRNAKIVNEGNIFEGDVLIENQFITVGEWNFGSAISLIMAIIIMGSMILTRKIDRDASDTASVEGGKLW